MDEGGLQLAGGAWAWPCLPVTSSRSTGYLCAQHQGGTCSLLVREMGPRDSFGTLSTLKPRSVSLHSRAGHEHRRATNRKGIPGLRGRGGLLLTGLECAKSGPRHITSHAGRYTLPVSPCLVQVHGPQGQGTGPGCLPWVSRPPPGWAAPAWKPTGATDPGRQPYCRA